MTYTINIVIKIVIATAAAVIFGNGSVVAFNHIPQKWFEDWEPDALDTERRVLPPKLLEADNAGRQRIPSTPWKWIFMGLFLASGIYLAMTTGLQYEIASMCVMAVMLEMAIADELYKIVPDQLQILLAVMAIGFVSFNENWWEPLAGAGVGLAIGLAVWGLGLIIFRSNSLGGADIKFFAVMGLIVGRRGILTIFILTTLFFAVESVFRIATKKSTLNDHNALMPAAFVAVMTYLLFLCNLTEIIEL